MRTPDLPEATGASEFLGHRSVDGDLVTVRIPLALARALIAQGMTENGARTIGGVLEDELTLAGAYVESTVEIPEGALVFAVSERVTEAITGATSFDLGIDGETDKFGGDLSVDAGTTNRGLIGPDPFYAATAVRATANGSDFTGGKVRIAIHYLLPVPPQA